MLKRTNQLVICKDEYSTQEEFENAIKNAIMLLLNNNYIATIRYDANDKGLGIVVLEFDYADSSYGSYYPHWLLPEEVEQIEFDDTTN